MQSQRTTALMYTCFTRCKLYRQQGSSVFVYGLDLGPGNDGSGVCNGVARWRMQAKARLALGSNFEKRQSVISALL